MANRTNFADFNRDEIALAVDFLEAEVRRRVLLQRTLKDLYDAAKNLGQTDQQIENKMDDLLLTFSGEWSLFILTGSDAIATAIQNDTTLPWLDANVAGQTIRQRLVNRLS